MTRHLISMEEGAFSPGYNNGWRHRLDSYAYQWFTYTYTFTYTPTGLISNIVDYYPAKKSLFIPRES